MSDTGKPVTEQDLHAYADGQLPADDMARVETWLASHPDDVARIREWQQQNRTIQAIFAPYRTNRPGDEDLLKTQPAPETAAPHRWRLRGLQTAAAVALFGLGIAVGHYLPASLAPAIEARAALGDEASSAFLIYASEVRHPVEVRADEKDHLVKWLSKRLGQKLAAPDLSARGFSLVGGRLVPVNGRAGALLMYEDAAGKRLTMLVGQSAADAVTSFRFAAQGSIETFYWIDEKLSYAVTGEIPRDVLRGVAEDSYQQFQLL